MEIKIKIEGKRVMCDVSDKECVKRPCFAPHRYTHYGRSIAGEDCSYQDKNYSCSTRNYHGCPDKALLSAKGKLKEEE